MKTLDCDFLVMGSGIAGLMSAIHLSKYGKVLVATKKERAESNTNYAQGGIACVVAEGDSLNEHIKDTIGAGAGLCNEESVRIVVEGGPDRISELEELGIIFSPHSDAPAKDYDLGKEGGHSHRRVLHIGDITGREVERVLLERIVSDPNISLREQCMIIDLVTTGWLNLPGPNRSVGAYALDSASGEVIAIRARHSILASGGGGKVYLYTSNPDIATGDGVAIAWRAGLPIKNMELIQFHPTCLYHPEAKSFLISEAVRGEGGVLVNDAGESFTEKHDPRGSLAPRDIVARACDREMKVSGAPCVYLDITNKSADFLRKRFPNIYEKCLGFGIDMAKDPIPVVPAAHYFCGGIEAGTDGATALPGLSAVGEVACTGLHGANRLASNSLLEAVVCSYLAAERIGASDRISVSEIEIPAWGTGEARISDEGVVVEHNWNEVRSCMWDYVGIVRTTRRLERALRRIKILKNEMREYYVNYYITPDILELRNIVAVGELIIRSALMRKESRGLHYILDYPDRNPDKTAAETIIRDEPGGDSEQ